jgi:hypothetical protein
VLTHTRVDAAIGQAKVLDGTIADDVGLDDLGYVGKLYVSIPDALWIYHYGWAMFALVQAARLIGADGVFQPENGKMGLKRPLEFGRTGRIAASARMSFRTLIAAYEDVFCEFGHEDSRLITKNGPHTAARRR